MSKLLDAIDKYRDYEGDTDGMLKLRAETEQALKDLMMEIIKGCTRTEQDVMGDWDFVLPDLIKEKVAAL